MLWGAIYILGGKIFVFILCLKQIFLSRTNLGGYAPVTTGLREDLMI